MVVSNSLLSRCSGRQAFTLVELLVVLAIIGLLVALLLPAVQRVREAGRRTSCSNRIRQVGLAVIAFHDAHRLMPPDPNRQIPSQSYTVSILPLMEQQAIYDEWIEIHERHSGGGGVPHGSDDYRKLLAMKTPFFRCPSDNAPTSDGGVSVRNPGNYVACTGTWFVNNGRQRFTIDGAFGFIVNRGSVPTNEPRIGFADFTDGLSQTAMISEGLIGYGPDDCRRLVFNTTRRPDIDDFESAIFADCQTYEQYGNAGGVVPLKYDRCRLWWNSTPFFTSYNHLMLPNTTSSTYGGDVLAGAYCAASQHPGGVNLVFADGHLTLITDQIDKTIWRSLGSRNGGDPTPGF